jgi:hypothetical protein
MVPNAESKVNRPVRESFRENKMRTPASIAGHCAAIAVHSRRDGRRGARERRIASANFFHATSAWLCRSRGSAAHPTDELGPGAKEAGVAVFHQPPCRRLWTRRKLVHAGAMERWHRGTRLSTQADARTPLSRGPFATSLHIAGRPMRARACRIRRGPRQAVARSKSAPTLLFFSSMHGAH